MLPFVGVLALAALLRLAWLAHQAFFITYLVGYGLGPSLRQLHVMGLSEAVRDSIGVLTFAVPLGLALGWWIKASRRRPGVALLAWLAVSGVVVVGLVSSLAGTGFRPRYVNWGVLPAVALGGLALAQVHNLAKAAPMGALTGLSLIAVWSSHADANHVNEDLRAALTAVNDLDPAGSPVAVMPGYLSPLARYYAFEQSVVRLPPIGPNGEGLPASLSRLKRSGAGWLVWSRSFHEDPQGSLLASLAASGELSPAGGFAGVDLYRLQRRPSVP